MNVRLYLWQRLTAAVMVPMIMLHLALIFYATRQGLTAADILSRTRGSVAWALFYGTFVLAASSHASIGIRNILTEWSPLKDRAAGVSAMGFALLLGALGLGAVAAVVSP
ncbi:MAG TPA: succinate dehydrogenase [Alphaproteobacteria bacterium]|nr:succinate dehydrogenase [Alphaproteobacteria bacterium]